jgi:parallel beta-helix repeat protein
MPDLNLRRKQVALVATAAAALAALLATPPIANAAKLSCGQTITKDTTLTSDVTGCRGVGLKIGADDVTLDLNGYTVAAGPRRNPKAHGIFNAGHDDVVIRGGTVRGFGAYGVRLADADRNLVEGMQLDANFTGIGLVESDRGKVRRNRITRAKFVGVNLTGGSGNSVAENLISGGSGAGVFVQNAQDEPARGHRIVRNQLDGNGIVVQAGPQRVRVAANAVVGTPGDGIAAFDPSTVVTGNAVTGAGGRAVFTPNGAAGG